MAQTVRLTITPDLEKALQILHKSTMGTLNTTELIKMAIGEEAKRKEILDAGTTRKVEPYEEINPKEMDRLSAKLFYEWAKEDGSLEINNISPDAKLKPFVPEPYVPNR